jgi:hypothetical protein
MKTTRYFQEQVLRKRPYLTLEICANVIAHPVKRLEQEDGRLRFWGTAHLPGETEARILRVITLEDGETVHNAFFDRNFAKVNS